MNSGRAAEAPRAQVGVRLPELPFHEEWVERARPTATDPGYEDVLLHTAEVLQQAGADHERVSPNRVFTSYREHAGANAKGKSALYAMLERRDIDVSRPGIESHEDSVRLRDLARVYSFWRYRQGMQRALDLVPYTSEQAVHTYIRVLLAWTRQWEPLAKTIDAERRAETRPIAPTEEAAAGVMRRARRSRPQPWASVALPIVVVPDLEALLLAHREEVGHDELTAGLVAAALAERARDAALAMHDDPSLSVLTAYNRVRGDANGHLGGALARVRLDAADLRLLQGPMRTALAWPTLSEAERKAFLAQYPAFSALFSTTNGGGDA